MPLHVVTNFEIQKYYQNEPDFNGVYSRNILPKIKDEAYVMNIDKYKSIGTHWIALYANGNNENASYDATYFDSFGDEHILKETQKFIGSKSIITNTYRIQAYESTICGYFGVGYIDFMLKGETLCDYTTLFSPCEYEKNVKIIVKYLQ